MCFVQQFRPSGLNIIKKHSSGASTHFGERRLLIGLDNIHSNIHSLIMLKRSVPKLGSDVLPDPCLWSHSIISGRVAFIE